MREIRLRGWHEKHKRYYNLGTIQEMCNEVEAGEIYGIQSLDPTAEHQCIFLDDLELEESTGLQDKNGKEVYEGDIVRDEVGPDGAAIGTVENINGDTVVKFLPGTIPEEWGHEYYPVFGKMDDSEVIGNVHENPNLLK